MTDNGFPPHRLSSQPAVGSPDAWEWDQVDGESDADVVASLCESYSRRRLLGTMSVVRLTAATSPIVAVLEPMVSGPPMRVFHVPDEPSMKSAGFSSQLHFLVSVGACVTHLSAASSRKRLLIVAGVLDAVERHVVLGNQLVSRTLPAGHVQRLDNVRLEIRYRKSF
jgi:hypothetical protein